MVPERPPAAATTQKQQALPLTKLVWTEGLDEVRRMIEGRTRFKGEF